MLRYTDCQRYREWKKQQDALLKGPKHKVKKKSRKDRKEIDCIEEEKKAKPKTVLKIRYRKCIQKETQKPRKDPSFKPKPVSSIDLLFRRIQPSLDVRHQLLLHRHAECFTEAVSRIDLTTLKQAALPKTRIKTPKTGTKRKRSRRRKKDKAEKTISEEEKIETTEKEEGVAQEQEETVNEEEGDEKEEEEEAEAEETIEEKEGEEVEETIEEEENIEEDDAGAIDDKDDKKEVERKKKDKFWCKKFKRKIDYESEDSECDSICSFDSDICLKGLALTAEDKKKIKENRRNIQASSAT